MSRTDTLSRRSFGMGAAGLVLSGCTLYSELPPVVIGGNPVDKDEPVMSALRASDQHGRFADALEATGLAGALEEETGPYTILAPTNEAFASLRPRSAAQRLVVDPDYLKRILENHIIPARLTSEDILAALPQLSERSKVLMQNDEVVTFRSHEEALRVLDMRNRSAKVTVRDAIASNGIVHVIDNVLLPREEETRESS